MTNQEMIKAFSAPKYDDMREYIYEIMLACPELRDTWTIECAAGQMADCAGNGVKLSVENALRLTAGEEPPDMGAILKKLDDAGIDDERFMELIFTVEDPTGTYEGCEKNPEALRRIRILEESAEYLAENPDIVVIARPMFWTGEDTVRLALAVFCDELTDLEQGLLAGMRDVCDEARLHREKGFLKLEFLVNGIWIV